MASPPPKNDNRRVCFVRHSYYPAELSVRREAETLVRDGFDVSIICLRGRGESPQEEVGGVKVYRMPIGHQRGKIIRYLFEYNVFFLLASIELMWLHLQNAFQFIQVNTMPDYLVFVALLPKLTGAKVILHVHEPMPELFKTMFPQAYLIPFIALIKLSEKLAIRFADRVLTVTREMRGNLGRRGHDINKITVIVNVPDEEMFRVEKYRDRIDDMVDMKRDERRKGIFRIITHGAIEERYGPDIIVRAVAKVKDRIPGIQFRLLGRGGYLPELLKLVDALKVRDQVHYVGFVPFDDMIDELLAADVGIVPMRENPYSALVHTNKMYDYIALGKPVIASRLDSVYSYFPEDAMAFFESGNDDELADRIYELWAHPEVMEERIKNATRIFETYRWERESKKYLGVYYGLIKQRLGPGITTR